MAEWLKAAVLKTANGQLFVGSNPTLSATFVCAILLVSFAAFPAAARSHHSRGGSFSYYLLSLSYAPDFCAQPEGEKDFRECGAGRRLGFVVHGLWPQGENSRGPEHCGPASPVGRDTVRAMLNYYPTESLIQHEWAMHGVCTGLSAGDYFAAARKARDAVAIPKELQEPARELRLSPSQIEAEFAAANPRWPKDSFRTSCYRDGELQEVRVCFDKELNARPCSASAGECRMDRVVVRPVH